ncbi:MAG: hypothetical protein H6R04_1098 [Burkholderiaceae bacterium]|nr:hypothetical protein [Burkholderiaceae bacterium]
MSNRYLHLILDDEAKEKILAITMHGNNKNQSIGFFRAATGLYYLSKIMVEDALDFKAIDKKFNHFIFDVIGRGHSITSILQYLSSKKVLWVLDSKSFLSTFLHYFPDIPFSKIQILLSVNLSVSKKISKIPLEGALKEWLLQQNAETAANAPQETDAQGV